MSDEIDVNFDHPANAGVLRYLLSRGASDKFGPSVSPDSVPHPYYNLGTHPDLVKRLWDNLGGKLPADCRWVLYGNPVLVHPRSGIVFGFAGGTHMYALRLPEPELSEATSAGGKRVLKYPSGSTLDINDIGEEWALCGWFENEDQWCLAAYRFAGDTR